jgi:L-ascorbate metabolism protein UlaG (beta-lactamase superfamily)/uncharacterized protein YndB with AHSA1/START domain
MDSITFGGTATTLIRLGVFTVLTDPNFLRRGQRAYLGKGLWSRRLTEPALQPGDIPALDAVVLSHLHGDHFDRIARRRLDRSVPVVTTQHAAGRLERYGFDTVPLRLWQSHRLARGGESLTIESLPAVHSRGLLGRLLPPVMGSLLVHRVAGREPRRIYLSGDTLTGDHLGAIRARHPEIDAAVVHLGGTRVLFHTVSMDAAQGVDLLRRIRPRLAVPVHYDDYRVFRSPLSDFLSLVDRDREDWRIASPARGDTVELAATAEAAESGTGVSGPELRLSRRLEAGLDRVWAAITDPEHAAEWLGRLSLSGSEHGRVRLRFTDDESEHDGVVVTCEPQVSFRLAWDDPSDGRIEVKVQLVSDGVGTVLSFVQSGVPRDATDQTQWTKRLDHLDHYLNTSRG